MDHDILQTMDRNIDLFTAIIRELLSQGLVEEFCDARITVGQTRCLCFIWAHENVTVGDISRGLGISYPAATKQISRLVEKGLVDRKNNPSDKRHKLIEITGHGREITTRIKPEKLRRLGALLGQLGEDDFLSLRKGIEAFLTVAVTDEELFKEICLHCGHDHVQTCIISNNNCQKMVRG